MRIGKLIWGLIVISIGLIFLLINYGVLSPTIWASIWKLWPLLLIVGGLSIISKSVNVVGQIIINVIVIITLIAALVWVIVPNKYSYQGATNSFNKAISSQYIDETPSDQSKSLALTIKTGAAKLNIDGNTDRLVEGTIEGNYSADVSRTSENGQENIELATSAHNIMIFNRIKNDWNLSLTKNLPTKLEMNTGAIDSNLDLSEVNLTSLVVKSGASSYDIRLGDKADKTTGEISVGASSIKISVPKGSGIKLINNSGASSNNFSSQGLKKSDDQYVTDGYDQASKKIELTIKAGASSVELDRF